MFGLLVAPLVLAYATQALWETQTEVIPLNVAYYSLSCKFTNLISTSLGKELNTLTVTTISGRSKNGGKVRHKEMVGGKAEDI